MPTTGRNDPCPCQSGKKYKHCHMRAYAPRERFTVKVNGGNLAKGFHYEMPDGKNWIKKPGSIQMRVFYEDTIHDEIDQILIPLIKKIPNNSVLQERFRKLRHKLYGIKYNLDNYVRNENALIGKFQKDYQGPDHDYHVDKPELHYEIEAFLFQVKSALDIMAQIIGIVHKFTTPTYSKNGNELIKMLTTNVSSELKEESTQIVKILEQHKKWVSDIVDMRDEVTHFSDLTGYLSFINYTWDGGPTADIAYPSMPDGQRAQKYLNAIFESLLQFVKETCTILKIQP